MVLIPLKSFARAKLRLAHVLDPDERAGLVRAMALRVIDASAPMQVWCVCDDPDVRAWAVAVGTLVEWTPGLGLNQAVGAAARRRGAAGAERIVIAHGDLPFASDLRGFADAADDEVLASTDRHGRGTNVLSVPAPTSSFEFEYAFGADSFGRHRAEAKRLGMRWRVIDDERLRWDVDTPEDLCPPAHLGLLPKDPGPIGWASPAMNARP